MKQGQPLRLAWPFGQQEQSWASPKRRGIERSHMGKIERGEHMPNLAIILRIARALNKSASELIAATEKNLQTEANANDG